ncbi:MAG: hypothetical protein HKP10_06505 [Kiritimatiellales bacterium]|nr:PilN domain-containing protein [Pontiella sp.]NNJ70923.1 hypothetical protein [Kiritimatiellales bacterium]
MRIRDKIITAACRTADDIEWTSLKIKQDGTESIQQGRIPLIVPDEGRTDEERTDDNLDRIELPAEAGEHLKGDLTVALRTSALLMRTMELPTADPGEIAEMVSFQIDKMSPFPVDQLAMSHEILRTTETSAQVLMAAAKRESIDAIGDAFVQKGVRIHSIDARVLGWLQLIGDDGKLSDEACEVIIINDGIDFVLVVMLAGVPVAFRSLHAGIDDPNVVDELVYEIGYTFTTLDVEHELPAPAAIHFWNAGQSHAALKVKLTEKSGVHVHHHDLDDLPPLSQGIVRRAQKNNVHIELIPREWVEHQQLKNLQRQFTIIASTIAAIWLLVMLVFFAIYKTRDIRLTGIEDRANALAPAATQALENREKLKALKVYTDRSDSSLECLREVTNLLPSGDIEFVSYSYTKGKGVTLRGTARDNDIVNNFFATLARSKLFTQLKDQSVTTKTTKGVRRAVFSITLALPSKEEK